MIELVKFFRILFMSAQISREVLKAFTEDHIQRLTNHNPGGIFTAILTDVTTAYNNYYGDLASESLNLAVQQGKTIAMKQAREDLEKLISEDEKLINYTYRTSRDIYEEFFPLGMSEYYQADLSYFETITLRFKEVLASHAGDFDAGFVTAYNDAQALYKENRHAQSIAKGNVASERSDLATTRPALAAQLTKNVLTIALKYLPDETKCGVYFDQAMIDAAFRASDRKVTAEVDPGETQLVFDNIIKGELNLKIVNNGEQTINISFMASPTDHVPADIHPVGPGQTIMLSAAELGWTSTIRNLNVTNSSTEAVSYTVEKI